MLHPIFSLQLHDLDHLVHYHLFTHVSENAYENENRLLLHPCFVDSSWLQLVASVGAAHALDYEDLDY